MKVILWAVGLLIAGVVALHGYFYAAADTIDPCKAAVTRIIQKERTKGSDLVASMGVLFSEQLESMLRSDGLKTCYRAAITGEAPEVVIKLDKDGLRAGTGR